MSCFFEFLADNGHKYCIAGISAKALMQETEEGTKPGVWSGNCAGEVKHFTSFKEVSEEYILKNCLNGFHYVAMIKAVFVAGSAKIFWIGRPTP
ncbi:MAG: hypothetical protein WCV55_03025 [Candidatus Paceibacterota bacterium]